MSRLFRFAAVNVPSTPAGQEVDALGKRQGSEEFDD